MGGEQQGQAGAGRGLARGPQVLGRPAKPPQGLSPSPSRRGPRGAPFPEAAWFGSRPLARPPAAALGALASAAGGPFPTRPARGWLRSPPSPARTGTPQPPNPEDGRTGP